LELCHASLSVLQRFCSLTWSLAVCMAPDTRRPWRPAGSQACGPVSRCRPRTCQAAPGLSGPWGPAGARAHGPAAGAGRAPAGRTRAAGQPRARAGGLCAAGARAARPAARHHTEGARPAALLLLVRGCTGAKVLSARSVSCMPAGVTLHACVFAIQFAPASQPGSSGLACCNEPRSIGLVSVA